MLVKIKIHRNPDLKDDAVVEECMASLMEQHPSIEGYQYERVDENVIQILMWGEFQVVQ